MIIDTRPAHFVATLEMLYNTVCWWVCVRVCEFTKNAQYSREQDTRSLVNKLFECGVLESAAAAAVQVIARRAIISIWLYRRWQWWWRVVYTFDTILLLLPLVRNNRISNDARLTVNDQSIKTDVYNWN